MTKTLFDYEPDDAFKAAPEVKDEHMCIECKHLREYNSSCMIDTCNKRVPGQAMSRSQRFDAQKIGKRKCAFFEKNDMPDFLLQAKKRGIEDHIAYTKKHYAGD